MKIADDDYIYRLVIDPQNRVCTLYLEIEGIPPDIAIASAPFDSEKFADVEKFGRNLYDDGSFFQNRAFSLTRESGERCLLFFSLVDCFRAGDVEKLDHIANHILYMPPEELVYWRERIGWDKDTEYEFRNTRAFCMMITGFDPMGQILESEDDCYDDLDYNDYNDDEYEHDPLG